MILNFAANGSQERPKRWYACIKGWSGNYANEIHRRRRDDEREMKFHALWESQHAVVPRVPSLLHCTCILAFLNLTFLQEGHSGRRIYLLCCHHSHA